MTALSTAEQMLYSTVKLTALKGGTANSTGTGFFFEFEMDDERKVPAIITNNHVINNNDTLLAIFHLADDKKPSGRFINCNIDLNTDRVVRHPDSNIDLCAILIGDILNKTTTDKTPIFLLT